MQVFELVYPKHYFDIFEVHLRVGGLLPKLILMKSLGVAYGVGKGTDHFPSEKPISGSTSAHLPDPRL